jgi:flagellar biosynthesis/type III secretory pathway chaperone
MKYSDKELLEVMASRLRSIAEDMQRLTTGNLAHNGCAIRGRLLRNAELIEKHLKQE